MEPPLNTERFFEPFHFSSVPETGLGARKSLCFRAFRSCRSHGTRSALSLSDVETERKAISPRDRRIHAGAMGGSRTENHTCLKTMKTKIRLIAVVLCVSLHVPQTFAQLQPPLAGSTPGQSLRNAATLTLSQSAALRRFVDTWSGHARAGIYTDANFRHDYATALGRLAALRTQFNYAAELALQLGRPGANNAVADLDAGLGSILELFAFLQEQYNAGTLDRVSLLRTMAALQKTLAVWEYELRRNGARLGVIW